MRTTIKALVTALVLGASAIASAAPCADAAPTAVITHPIVIAHRGWVDLSGGIQLRGDAVIPVGAVKGEFRRLELVRGFGDGETRVNTVAVTFGDGQVETVRLDRTMTTRDGNIQIDLDGGRARHIQSVALTGTSHGRNQVELRAS